MSAVCNHAAARLPIALLFDEEKFTPELAREAQPLLIRHYEEIGRHKDVRPLNPAYEKMFKLAELGLFKVITVRGGPEKRLMGYASWLLSPHLHYQDWLVATETLYFFDPSVRRRDAYYLYRDLFFIAEEFLRKWGVKSVVYHAKTHVDSSPIFKRLKYQMIETVWEKVL